MRIILHLPLDLQHSRSKSGVSGSYLRPQRMLQSFEELGYVVDVVWGSAAERKKRIQKLKTNVSDGIKYDFIYSESSTMPTLLTEPNHLPISPSVDFGFFYWAKKNGIPVGLFYRDIHWRFEHYKKHVSWYKAFIARFFYYLDLLLYHRFVDCLFLPSLKMLDKIPGSWSKDRVYALPPGGSSLGQCAVTTPITPPIKLFYVGGVLPPLYDLSSVFEGLMGISPGQVQLTLCCRETEWEKCKNQYKLSSNSVIQVVHENEDDMIKKRYINSDISLMLYEPCFYREFAMPLKLFEAIGYCLPIITNSGTAVGELVEQEDIGWVIKSGGESFNSWLKFIIEHPEEIEKKREILRKRAMYHTWQERAKTVARCLLGGTD